MPKASFSPIHGRIKRRKTESKALLSLVGIVAVVQTTIDEKHFQNNETLLICTIPLLHCRTGNNKCTCNQAFERSSTSCRFLLKASNSHRSSLFSRADTWQALTRQRLRYQQGTGGGGGEDFFSPNNGDIHDAVVVWKRHVRCRRRRCGSNSIIIIICTWKGSGSHRFRWRFDKPVLSIWSLLRC